MTANAKKLPDTAKGAHGRHHGPAPKTHSGNASAPRVKTPLACPGLVEVILFGKSHWVTPEQYLKNSAKYADLLNIEKNLLLGEFDALRSAHADLMSPPWYITAGNLSTSAWEHVFQVGAKEHWDDYVRAADGPTEQTFKVLRAQLDKVTPPLESVDEKDILRVGKQLRIFRDELRDLRQEMSSQRHLIIKQTETTAQYAELVEDSSVQVLMMVAEKASLNPVQELSYKIGIMVVEGGMKTGAAALADMNWRGEFLLVIRNRLPSILADWLVRSLGTRLERTPLGAAAKAVLTTLARLFIDAICGIYQLLMNTGGLANEADFKAFFETQLYSSLATVFSRCLQQGPDSPVVKKAAGVVMTALAQACASEAYNVRQLTKEEPKRTYTEALLVRAPFFIARVAQQLVLGIIGQIKAHPIPSTDSGAPPPSPARPTRVARVRQKLASTMRQFQRTTQRPRLRPLTSAEMSAAQRDSNLTPEVIEALRNYSHQSNKIQAIRIVNQFFSRHHGSRGKRPKSEEVKSKTAREGRDHEGLAVRPTTPEDLAAYWNDTQLGLMRNAGILCREDGLIFHPDMLLASTPKEHRAEMAVVVDMLKRVGRAEGVKVDLGSEPARRALAAELASLDPVKRRQVEALLAQALRSSAVGYYGDLDYLEEIDATTGKRVPLGSIDKNDRASAAAKANLRRTGVAITPRLPGDEGPLEDHNSLGQHGSAAEVVDPATGLLKFAHIGDIIVALPDGKLVKIPYPPAPEGLTGDEAVRAQDAALRQTLEEYVRRYTGPAHLSADDRHVDAQTADPDVPPPPPRAPRLTAKTAGALPRSDLEITETPSERGTPASRLDLHASLVARGLVLIHPDNGKFFEGLIDPVDLAALAATLARGSVVAGVDAERRAIVVVTHDDHGVADALKRLGGAHVALQRAGVGLRRWWEIVAPIYLASWGGIAGVLPDEPGDLATASDARTADLSSAHPPKGYTLKRFRAIRGRRSYAARGDRALAVRLENVWERSRDHAFKFLATTIGGRDVSLFRAPPARHDDETAGAVVAPQWVFDYDLRTREGLSRALVALRWLEPAESADPAAIQEKVRRFQASTMKLRVDGVVGRKTRAALRAALAEVEGDGIVESEAP